MTKRTPRVDVVREAEAQHPELVRFAKIMAKVASIMHTRCGHQAMQELLRAISIAEKEYPTTGKQHVVEKLIDYAKRVSEDYEEERILGNQRGTASLKLLTSAVNKLAS